MRIALLNPGSPTGRRRQPAYSWALLTIDGATVTQATLVTFPDRATVL